ncbi:MAG: HIT domain-containing protein [Deltaproteobacteria bacterium]|nr:HIT domain-containing protein [Deltaproteobacteria bacterium]
MKQLWAPWRMQFITQPRTKGCIFCQFLKQKNDRENLILYRGRSAFIILNKFPYNNGHLMVVPHRHTAELRKLDSKTDIEMMQLVQKSVDALKKTMNPQGFNVGLNLGHAAGAGIVDHLHFHVVPRWVGDTNFMPIFSGDKVMVEYLHETYDRLHAILHPKIKKSRAKK